MRGNVLQTKVHYRGQEDDFVIFVVDPQSVRDWLKDKSIPLAQVVDGWKVFVTHKSVLPCLSSSFSLFISCFRLHSLFLWSHTLLSFYAAPSLSFPLFHCLSLLSVSILDSQFLVDASLLIPCLVFVLWL